MSSAAFGSARVELEFPFGIDLSKTLIDVINALNRVSGYPENVDEPRIYATSFSSNSFMYFRVTPLPGNPRTLDMVLMQDFIDDHVRNRMETVPGVSSVAVYGGAERQIQIRVDPVRLAERNLTMAQVRRAIQLRNRDVSGGEIESGKRRYLLRTIGRFRDVEDLRDVIVDHSGDALIRLGEIGEVSLGHFEINRYSYTNGSPAIGMSVRRQAGSNVIDIKRAMMPKVDAINREVLEPAGMRMFLVADDVGYVEASLHNVWTNLAIGALLASLWLNASLLRRVEAVESALAAQPRATPVHHEHSDPAGSCCQVPGNIATRLGRTLQFDPAAEKVLGDEEAQSLLRREYRPDHWAIPANV